MLSELTPGQLLEDLFRSSIEDLRCNARHDERLPRSFELRAVMIGQGTELKSLTIGIVTDGRPAKMEEIQSVTRASDSLGNSISNTHVDDSEPTSTAGPYKHVDFIEVPYSGLKNGGCREKLLAAQKIIIGRQVL